VQATLRTPMMVSRLLPPAWGANARVRELAEGLGSEGGKGRSSERGSRGEGR
jgi:hypothetical protein